jgi:hypothetical protein
MSEIQKSADVSIELDAPPIPKPSATRTATIFAGRFLDLDALIPDTDTVRADNWLLAGAGSNRRAPPCQLCGQKAKSLCLLCFSGSDHRKNARK